MPTRIARAKGLIGASVPVLPLHLKVLFPGQVALHDLGDGVQHILDALPSSPVVALFGRADPSIQEPGTRVACAARVLRSEEDENGAIRFEVHGLARVRIVEITARTPYLEGSVIPIVDEHGDTEMAVALAAHAQAITKDLLRYFPETVRQEALTSLATAAVRPFMLSDFLAGSLPAPFDSKMALLAQSDVRTRLGELLVNLTHRLEHRDLRARSERWVAKELDREIRRRGGAQPSEAETRRMALTLHQRFLLAELRTGRRGGPVAENPPIAKTPYRASASEPPHDATHRISFDVLTESQSASRSWWARALGVGPPRAYQLVDEQVEAIRKKQRDELRRFQLEATRKELEGG